MKKYYVLLSTVVLIAVCGCSKWAGDPITQKFSIDGGYTDLKVEDAFDVTVSDTVDQVIVTVGENVMPKVIVENKNNKVNIYLKGWATNGGKEMKVILPYSPQLERVRLSGASGFHSDYTLKAQKVEIDLSGSSVFYGDIEADDVNIDLSGASDVNGDVTATNLFLDMSGSSDARLTGDVATLEIGFSGSSTLVKRVMAHKYALSCDQCIGLMSGSSDAYIHCDGSINVSLSGGSNLYYTGDASTRGCSTSGSSKVIHDAL